MMKTNPSFEQIKDFVQDQSNQALIIRAHDKGFKVNNYVIAELDSRWNVMDRDDKIVTQFFSRKFAVLYAVLMHKKMNREQAHLHYLDQQLAVASEDQKFYNSLLQKEQVETLVSVYEARLSRAKQILDSVRSQITAMEKTLALQ